MISASEISEHEYCELAWYYKKKGVKIPEERKAEKEQRFQKGKDMHCKIEADIEFQNIKMGVGALLICLSLSLLGFLLFLLFSL